MEVSNSTNALKISVVGDSGTGKSSMILRFLGSSNEMKRRSSGLEGRYKGTILSKDGRRFPLNIVDSVDLEYTENMGDYVRAIDSDVVILTYSTNEDASYNNLFLRCSRLQKRKDEFSQQGSLPRTLIVGTKSDLVDLKQVPHSSGEKLMRAFGMDGFIECSSKSGDNIDKVFSTAVELALKKRKEEGKMAEPVVTMQKREFKEQEVEKPEEAEACCACIIM
ncbi:DEKNAAC101836 [Brettanomyces naardenensis]|uniref:DEKNAAC101837 n=1 Tax=Brettanomyces naardenensis TaxID=13370 RepID=A0A448YIZ7_BRENA|nr:DEKNAAC101836 [Brettanomyces naardenensis]